MNIGRGNMSGKSNESRKGWSSEWIFGRVLEQSWYESVRMVSETIEWMFWSWSMGVLANDALYEIWVRVTNQLLKD